MWNSALRNFSFCFSGVFHFYWQNFHFGGRTKPWAIFYEVLRVCWYFLISWDPNINSLCNLWGNSFILCLLLTITLEAFSYACASQQNFKISWKCFFRFLDCLIDWVFTKAVVNVSEVSHKYYYRGCDSLWVIFALFLVWLSKFGLLNLL